MLPGVIPANAGIAGLRVRHLRVAPGGQRSRIESGTTLT